MKEMQEMSNNPAMNRAELSVEIMAIFQKLYSGESMTQAESYQLFTAIAEGKISESRLSAALISMKLRGETPAELAGAASAFTTLAKPFPAIEQPFADIVGTGGDGLNTVNISTASALVASCCGATVIKHGNRSVSSLTGSSDLLQALGIDLFKTPEAAKESVMDNEITFLFAPHYHTGFKYAAKTRAELKTRTIFNILGPLTNPARPKRAMIGVYDPQLTELIAQTGELLGYEHLLVIHGGGMDEVALHSATKVTELKAGNITTYEVNPADFGLHYHPLEALRGGDALENRRTLLQLLSGNAPLAHQEAVAINVALFLTLFGKENLQENAEQALEAIRSGRALEKLAILTEKDSASFAEELIRA